jgi:hypothetical protein
MDSLTGHNKDIEASLTKTQDAENYFEAAFICIQTKLKECHDKLRKETLDEQHGIHRQAKCYRTSGAGSTFLSLLKHFKIVDPTSSLVSGTFGEASSRVDATQDSTTLDRTTHLSLPTAILCPPNEDTTPDLAAFARFTKTQVCKDLLDGEEFALPTVKYPQGLQGFFAEATYDASPWLPTFFSNGLDTKGLRRTEERAELLWLPTSCSSLNVGPFVGLPPGLPEP